MRKTFILDTNILIHDPYCIYNFRGNDVILPIYVIEEIDKLKRNQNTAIQARLASRVLDEIRKEGSLFKGVELKNDIFFRVEIKNDMKLLPEVLKKDVVDNYIISVTLGIKKDNPDKRVIIVTKDINMRIKADALGLEVEDYSTDKVDYTELYDGFYEVEVDSKTFGQYEKNGKMDFMDLGREDIIPTPNSFFKLNCKGNILTGRYENGKIKKFLLGDSSPWGLRARNDEQRFAMELLMDENIKVVTLVGGAGTGKTLLAIATGLELVVERKKYKKLLIARPIIPMGKDLGYLPGSEKEKLKPWMQPIFDNIDFLSEAKDDKTGEKVVEGLEAMGILKIEALTYIRGRSIPRGLIIIDEAQNLTPLEIKTIVTRAGENTKIIFTGDPQQIDNPYLDSNTNGLTYLADRLKNEEIVGHITLKKGERSKLAEIAAKLL
ncbi:MULTISPECIES: PhoH family protein [Fusobacterium]|jgi:PhoH-like ATPase|uniref:PhoH family protein n=2 Tax=Fusobacterium varium TaxID=856 RepID=A0ABM6U7I0_FUSVA|nr:MULTISPECIES: PhoH family protein [Fusobacterium]AVQ32397.1 PhoH family protein [Fusobacterium varium ATCC 27725]EES64334.1 PhoH family protein [Fusobacterium varium ATCC 27725]MCF0170257.1 PhoH family protein [Fusobacterium varium]MCF2672410.1 PhoH family protein [Fusobacterium varium]MDY4006406.1 PhoH family protein [Fusobacterium varium]